MTVGARNRLFPDTGEASVEFESVWARGDRRAFMARADKKTFRASALISRDAVARS
jgi:hypothetical protein